MSSGSAKLQSAIQSRSLGDLTKAIGELADRLGYQLRPPFTQVKRFTSKEDAERFSIQFEGQLSLHYTGPGRQDEGLIFSVGFSGSALADTPTPPINELFYAASVDSMSVYGYGARWKGETITTPNEFSENLEVAVNALSKVEMRDLFTL
jgi:hypothetical protein